MIAKCFQRIERQFHKKIISATITNSKNFKTVLLPFSYQPIALHYDEEGIESCEKCGNKAYMLRFTLKNEGVYQLSVAFEDNQQITEELIVKGRYSNGYVQVSERNKQYFSYSNGTDFFPIGINLAFPRACIVSNGYEFGTARDYSFMGLRQYERWFKQCSENGVNVVRIWIGSTYFSPDTKNAEELDDTQLSKIDMLVALAKKYGLKLKLTLEQFRYFHYDSNDSSVVFRHFNKMLWLKEEKCTDIVTWLTKEKWKNAWLNKVTALASRYAGDTEIFAIELWNEMNCLGARTVRVWNEEMLPKVKALFPDNMVINSLGSLESETVLTEHYQAFPWELSDFKQMHRYLDQGAEYKDATENPIEMIQTGVARIKSEHQPLFVAETGAVNNCHSGEFKYYSCDNRGMLFVDCVYTPVFTGCAGCGNIWHWDERYVESKNLYRYFKPLAEMTKDVNFINEKFVCCDFSDNQAYILMLKGETVSLVFVRNKEDNWKTVLRDLKEPQVIFKKTLPIKGNKQILLYPIWDRDTTTISVSEDSITLHNILYGTMFKIKEENQ